MRPHCFKNMHPETQRSSRRLVTVYTILIMLQIQSHSVKVRQQAPVNYTISWALWWGNANHFSECNLDTNMLWVLANMSLCSLHYIPLHSNYIILFSSLAKRWTSKQICTYRHLLSFKNQVFHKNSLKVQPSPTDPSLCTFVLRLRRISDLFIKLKVIKWV